MNLKEFKAIVAALPEEHDELRVVRRDSTDWEAINISSVNPIELSEIEETGKYEILIEVY